MIPGKYEILHPTKGNGRLQKATAARNGCILYQTRVLLQKGGYPLGISPFCYRGTRNELQRRQVSAQAALAANSPVGCLRSERRVPPPAPKGGGYPLGISPFCYRGTRNELQRRQVSAQAALAANSPVGCLRSERRVPPPFHALLYCRPLSLQKSA